MAAVLRVVVFFAVEDFDAEVLDGVFAEVDFAAFVVFFAVAAVLRPRRLAGPAARFSASRRKASAGSIVSGAYCLGSVRLVSPSVMYAP